MNTTQRSHKSSHGRSNRKTLGVALILSMALPLAAGCTNPAAVEVTEVLNHSLCKTLRKGVTQVAFEDLANIRGSQLLSTSEGSPTTASTGVVQENLQDMVLVAISNGPQPTPGYGFELESVGGDSTEVLLQYRWLTPAPDAVMVQMVTSPCSVVQLRSTPSPTAVSAWLNGALLGKLALTE